MNMKNKKFKFGIFTGLLLLMFASCQQEEFLKEVSKSDMTTDLLFQSYEGIHYFMNGLYAQVYIERERGNAISVPAEQLMNTQMQTGVDNCAVHAHDGTDLIQPLGEWNLVLPSWGHNRRTFEWIFRVINSANTVITRANYVNVEWTEEQKNQIIAEARTIRAWAYRHATYLWGQVPLIDEEVVNVITDWEKSDMESLYDLMEEDLLFAEQHLAKFHEHPGKLSRAVASHYLAELYLRMERWQDASDAADRIISDSDYALVTSRYGVRAGEPGVPFMDQFYDGNVKRSEGNNEVLWAWIYEPNVINENRGTYLNRYWSHRTWQLPFLGTEARAIYGAQPLSRYAITHYALDLYEPNDDRFSEYALTHYLIALKYGRDSRIKDYVDTGDTVWTTYFHPDLAPDQKMLPNNDKRDFMWTSTRKWEHSLEQYATTINGYTYGDQPYLRLAETYLIKAEALFHLNRTIEAAEAINVLRRRANASEVGASDITLDFILDERSRELIGEEQRRYTLVRTGTWLERYLLYNGQNPGVVEEKHSLFPIPQSVIDANTDKEMDNNPGY